MSYKDKKNKDIKNPEKIPEITGKEKRLLNLKTAPPFSSTNQPENNPGRPKGSLNLSTIIKKRMNAVGGKIDGEPVSTREMIVYKLIQDVNNPKLKLNERMNAFEKLCKMDKSYVEKIENENTNKNVELVIDLDDPDSENEENEIEEYEDEEEDDEGIA